MSLTFIITPDLERGKRRARRVSAGIAPNPVKSSRVFLHDCVICHGDGEIYPSGPPRIVVSTVQ
jgi:hypothetical protein